MKGRLINLDVLLDPSRRGTKSNVISLDELLRAPVKSEEAEEVVIFWTDWTCRCGRHYEAPTYGDTFTRYQRYSHGRESGSVYKPYLKGNHADLPRRIDIKHIHLRHCPQCILEDRLERDRQGDLFHATA